MRASTACACALGLGALANPAFSQGAPNRLEEVMVTATRKAESAQTTPLSLVTFDAQTLETLGINTLDDLQAQVPNLVIDQFPSSNQTLRVFIRGVGISDVQITQDPAVGIYLDGVYLARSTGLASDVADLERIEILRGPQGTLYGRNTTGGAINLVSRRPDSQAVQFTQIAGVGGRGRLYSKTSLNLPAGETQAVKLAVLLDQLDGFIDNKGPGEDFGDKEALAYRVDWRAQFSDTFTLDYSYDRSRIESTNYTPQAVAPGIPTGGPQDAVILSSQRFIDYSSHRLERLATSVELLPTDTDIEGHALTLSWELNDLRFRSISAWRELSDDSYVDFASGASEEYRLDLQRITLAPQSDEAVEYPAVKTRVQQEQWSQEFQLIGEPWTQLEYVAGLYWFREEANENWFPLHHINSFPLMETDDQIYAVTLRAEHNQIENEALALYGQVTWTPPVLDSRLKLSGGWRYSRDQRSVRRSFAQDSYLDTGTTIIGPVQSIDYEANADQDFEDHSFSAIASLDLGLNAHSYLKYVEAYKSGGFNTRDPDPAYFERGFDEEKNHAFELGLKSEWLDQALRANVALFYSEFTDLQLNFLLPGSLSDTRVLNSGEATLRGLELDLAAYLTTGLLVSFDYAYLDSEIDPVVDPFTGAVRSLRFPSAPRHTGNVRLDYRFGPGPAGVPSIHINYAYMGQRKDESPALTREAYELVNARLTLSKPLLSGEATAALWINNIFDENYHSFAFDNLPHASRAVLWGEPRSWGLDLKYTY